MPLVPFLPCLGIFANFILVSSIEGEIWAMYGIFNAIGVLIYFSYGFWNSKLQESELSADKVDDLDAYSNTMVDDSKFIDEAQAKTYYKPPIK